MIRPVETPVGQGFGENPTSVLPAGHWVLKQFGNYQPDGHAGEDYPCPVGTPIRAVTSGRVLHVGFYGGTYRDNPYWIAPNFAGYCYVIDHGAFIGIYAHGKDKGSRVSVGQSVAEGQVIGLSGNTGGSTGPHLHFEALPDRFVVNSRMYGRIDPATLFAGGGLAAQGTITPSEEDDMPLNDNDKAEIKRLAMEGALDALEEQITDTTGQKMSVMDVARQWRQKWDEAPSELLDAGTGRGGADVGGGETSLRGMIAYFDQSRIDTIKAAAAAQADGAPIEAILQAVRDGLAAGVKVEANVTVGQ